MHVSQTVIPPLEFVSQLFMIDAQAVQNCGIQIMHGQGVLSDVITEVIGLTECHARFHSASGCPDGEATGMMITTVIGGRQCSLTIDGATKFTRPDNECVIQHAPLFQIENQGGRRLIGFPRELPDFCGQVEMMVPASMIELNEADASFCQTSG